MLLLYQEVRSLEYEKCVLMPWIKTKFGVSAWQRLNIFMTEVCIWASYVHGLHRLHFSIKGLFLNIKNNRIYPTLMFDVAVETCKKGSSILTKCRSKEHNSSKICHLLQNRVSAVGDTMELTDGLWTP